MKHLILATMNPSQNFVLWYKEAFEKILGSNFASDDILNFDSNIDKAIAIESFSFDGYRFTNYFQSLDLLSVNERLLKQRASDKPNFIHWCADSHFRLFLFPETALDIYKTKNVFNAGYFGDCFINFDINKFWLPVFNCIRVMDPERIHDYRAFRKDVFWQIAGGNRKIDRSESSTKKYDVIFIGRPYGIRPELLIEISTKMPDIKLAIFGDRKWKKYRQLRKHYHGYASNNEFYDLISQSKISLAMMEGMDGVTPHYNAKVFDSALKDVMALVSENKLLMDVHGLVEDQDLVVYHNKSDLLKKIRRYVDDDEARLRISKSLNAKILNQSLENILADMCKSFESNPQHLDLSHQSDILAFAGEGERMDEHALSKQKYVILSEKGHCDRYLPYLVDIWDKSGILQDINIGDAALPGLILNYRLPVSFRSIIYRTEFFLKHRRSIQSNNILRKYWFFFTQRHRAQLLRMIIVKDNTKLMSERLVQSTVRVLRKVKQLKSDFFG